MGQYIFTPSSDVLLQDSNGTYGNKLYFKSESKDYNYAPFDGTESVLTRVTSAIQEGDYIYALTRVGSESTNTDNFSERKYPLSDSDLVKVKSIQLTGADNNIVEITLSAEIQSPIFGETGLNAAFDYFLFDREYNAINKVKIGFDRKPAQLVNATVPLFDTDSSQELQDNAFNPLFTEEKTFFEEAQLSVNATSVVVNNEKPVPITEQFPATSEVSNSLLGIPRAEEQLSLFSDVSTLGLDENTWEFYEFQTQRVRYREWEYRDSDQGSRYSAKLIENIPEQAIELSTNAVPYGYPYNESQSQYYVASQYFKYRNFIILGNLLYLYAEKYQPGTQSGYLNPANVRWGIGAGGTIGGQAVEFFQTHFFGNGVSEKSAFRYIDKWTETWMSIKRGEFTLTKAFIDQVILNATNPINAELKSLIFERYKTLNEEQLGDAGAGKTNQMDSVIRNHFNSSGYVFDEFSSQGTQPGYNQRVIQQVVLQTKEVYRYQPGRISGFTFGTRVDIDPTTEANFAEWGCVNESDEYVFQLAGKNINIVRRSTVPLTNQSLSLSGGFNENDTEFYNKIEGEKPLSGGVEKPTYYELKVPQNRWNGDQLNGNGRSGYDIDPENVTMWKIEFSWYGAIGVQFYAYVPVGNGEARWVKLHRIIIENSLTQANLQDPYFRMRYNLVVGDRTVTTNPQFVYKYGSSVYIDGGDLGTSTVKSFLSEQKVVPEDKDEPLGTNNDLVPDDEFQPMLGIKSKTFIANRDGKLRPSRIITIPTSLNVSADNLIEVDILESEAGRGFGFTYDNGLRWNPNASPAINEHNLLLTAGIADPYEFVNQGGSALAPYAPKLIDFIFDTQEEGIGDAVTTLAIVKQDTISIDNTNRNAIGQGKVSHLANVVPCPRQFVKLTPGTDSPLMIDETYDDAKVDVGGLNNVYVDWESTLLDDKITKITSNITGKPMAARFRIKKIGKRDYDSTINSDIAFKESVSPANPLFELSVSASYFKTSKSNITYNWYSGGTSLAYPRIPEYRYSQGAHGIGVGTKSLPEFSPSASSFGGANGIAAEFVRNFGEGERNPSGGPFKNSGTDIADPGSNYFPFRSFTNGLQEYYYIKREVFREYDDIGGICVPYSYAFGMTKLQKWDNAICTSDIGFQGTEIEIRFLNPQAGGVALFDHPFLGKKIDKKKFPEFRIGFTNKVPAKVTMDGTAQILNENEKWNGTFEGANDDGSAGFLQDKDYIFTDYRCNHTHYSVNTGEYAYGERNWDYAQAMQDDYRIKGVLNEGKEPALDYNIGGMPSYLRLKVAADFSVFTNLTFHDDFNSSSGSSFIKTYKPTISGGGYNAADVLAGTTPPLIEFDGVDMADIFYTSASNPNDTGANEYNYNDRGLDKFGLSSNNNFIVIRDNDGSFNNALRGGLKLKGGGVSIRHITGSGETKDFITDLTYITEPIKFYYYAKADGTIDEEAYTSGLANRRTGFLIQVSGQLIDTSASSGPPMNTTTMGGALPLTTTSSLIFKIVKLQYPSQPNGTQLREVQKVFGDSSTTFYPVIKLREDAQINNINIRVIKPGEDPVVISPTWKLYGASQLIKPLTANSPGFNKLNNLDGAAGGVLSAVNENFISKNRLDGIETDIRMNKRLRKSLSKPLFKGLANDPLAIRQLPGTTNVLYDVRNKPIERSKKITSYYFGKEEGTAIVNESISLKSTFGEDRNRILPDQLGTKATFIRAQKVNLGDSEDTAKVQVGVNVSEL
jgi:hypothetical protein